MHIFIDESGTFSGLQATDPAISVLGALIIGDAKLGKLFEKYARLRERLPKRGGEVKGSRLNERQVAEVIDLLRRNEAIFAASMIDMSAHTAKDIETHRATSSASLAANLTEGHTAELRAGVADLQKRMAGFSPQLYAQMTVTRDLLHRVLQEAITYHCQRNPRELAAFHWVIDGKAADNLVTDWEDWWENTIVIWLQAMSLAKPGAMLPTGDYRYFERFFIELPEYLKAVVNPDIAERAGIDLQAVFRESFRFSSDPEPGLELVDIVTNAARRAVTGNLGPEGWLPLRSIMIHQNEPYIRPVSMNGRTQKMTASYLDVIRQFTKGGRTMITKSNWDRFDRQQTGPAFPTSNPPGRAAPR